MTQDILVLVNYNGEKLLPECLMAIARQTRRPGEIIVLDNASADKSLEILRRDFPFVTIIASDKNLGFAEGNNQAIRERPAAKYVALLNTDTKPAPDWYEKLIGALEKNANGKTAVAWSNVQPPDMASPQLAFNSTLSPLGYTIRNRSPENFIFYASGSAMAYRRDLLGEPFLSEYFMYYEDVQLSWRARLSGYDVIRVPDANVLHYGSVTTRRFRSRKTFFYQFRNRLLTLFLHFESKTLLALSPLLFGDLVFHLLLGAFCPARSSLAILDAVAWLIKSRERIQGRRRDINLERKLSDAEILDLFDPGPTNQSPEILRRLFRVFLKWTKNFIRV